MCRNTTSIVLGKSGATVPKGESKYNESSFKLNSMKKNSVLILLALVLTAKVTMAQSTAEENITAEKEYKRADSIMNREYARVLKMADDDPALQQAIRDAQKIFLSYREKIGYAQRLYHLGGSAEPYFQFRALRKVTENRTEELELLFENN